MFGVQKVLQFSMIGNFENVRKITDDIIISLMKNTKNKTNDLVKWTYGSTIREDFLSRFTNAFYDKYSPWGEYKEWTVRIYILQGNRQSKLSIAQNPDFRLVIIGDEQIAEEPCDANEN